MGNIDYLLINCKLTELHPLPSYRSYRLLAVSFCLIHPFGIHISVDLEADFAPLKESVTEAAMASECRPFLWTISLRTKQFHPQSKR